jgi:hypothetical protein
MEEMTTKTQMDTIVSLKEKNLELSAEFNANVVKINNLRDEVDEIARVELVKALHFISKMARHKVTTLCQRVVGMDKIKQTNFLVDASRIDNFVSAHQHSMKK